MVDQLGPQDPTHIADWELVGRLGTGGMGTVWLAQDPASGAPAAVKTLRADVGRHASVERFRREVRATLQVTSPWMATVLDVDLDHTPPYLATEYVPGPTLEEHVQRDGPLTEPEAVAFAAALADGLASLHTAGVVHRDLSARNIILSPRGPKIIDLGVAQIADATRLTATGTALGTPASMAPEQITGGTVGPAADVFAWGAAVCFAATGRWPFGTGRSEAVAYRIVHEPPQLDHVPDRLRGVVANALDKVATKRPTARQLRHRLVDAPGAGTETVAVTELVRTALLEPAGEPSGSTARLDGAQVVTEPSMAPRQPSSRRPWRRWRLVALAATVAVVTVGLLLALQLPGHDTDPLQASSPSPATDPRPAELVTPDPTIGTPSDVPAVSPETTRAAQPDPLTADLSDQLPAFHTEQHRFAVSRDDGPDAVTVVSVPRQDEPRPVSVSLFEWDRSDYAAADELDIDCGFLMSDPAWDDGVFYLDCTGGASAWYLYAIRPQPLELAVHPYRNPEGNPDDLGWLHSGGWERRTVAGTPDDLVLTRNTCDPSCADGQLIYVTLAWDPVFEWWNADTCTEPDGTVRGEDGWNASASPLLDLSVCW